MTTLTLPRHATWSRTGDQASDTLPRLYRDWLTGFLTIFGINPDNAVLTLSELATNAVTHALPPYDAHARIDGDVLILKVIDQRHPQQPADQPGDQGAEIDLDDLDALLDQLSEHGRGQLICDALCRERHEHTDRDTGRHTVTVVIDLARD